MCPYVSLSCRNTHTVILINRRTPWSWHRFFFTHTLASTLSTSCCSCTFSAGCCLAVRVLGHFLRILCNICILLDFSSFICFPPKTYSWVCGPCVLWFSFVAGGGGGGGDRDVDREGERRVCCLSFYFCLRRPLRGAGTLLSVVVAVFAISSSLSNW